MNNNDEHTQDSKHGQLIWVRGTTGLAKELSRTQGPLCGRTHTKKAAEGPGVAAMDSSNDVHLLLGSATCGMQWHACSQLTCSSVCISLLPTAPQIAADKQLSGLKTADEHSKSQTALPSTESD